MSFCNNKNLLGRKGSSYRPIRIRQTSRNNEAASGRRWKFARCPFEMSSRIRGDSGPILFPVYHHNDRFAARTSQVKIHLVGVKHISYATFLPTKPTELECHGCFVIDLYCHSLVSIVSNFFFYFWLASAAKIFQAIQWLYKSAKANNVRS